MNGPEHYAAAENWINRSARAEESAPAVTTYALQRAQVHATLAMAAAMVDPHTASEWAEVTWHER